MASIKSIFGGAFSPSSNSTTALFDCCLENWAYSIPNANCSTDCKSLQAKLQLERCIFRHWGIRTGLISFEGSKILDSRLTAEVSKTQKAISETLVELKRLLTNPELMKHGISTIDEHTAEQQMQIARTGMLISDEAYGYWKTEMTEQKVKDNKKRVFWTCCDHKKLPFFVSMFYSFNVKLAKLTPVGPYLRSLMARDFVSRYAKNSPAVFLEHSKSKDSTNNDSSYRRGLQEIREAAAIWHPDLAQEATEALGKLPPLHSDPSNMDPSQIDSSSPLNNQPEIDPSPEPPAYRSREEEILQPISNIIGLLEVFEMEAKIDVHCKHIAISDACSKTRLELELLYGSWKHGVELRPNGTDFFKTALLQWERHCNEVVERIKRTKTSMYDISAIEGFTSYCYGPAEIFKKAGKIK
ncbi:hypothetical protein BT63DRAFT_456596 [Microthyrium microscopicum]|uniref:Prion-inhibition and propagation HeLo domain-containing protein n=1 Tax=Microthyrium microscopicum TaxID=703497 RepID=A0A6A6U7M6_9PEZI|nr:hypothetical protein BT63DRAFT_456596 [Microthyrium microscopicum]